MSAEKLMMLGIAAAKRADAIGCACCTQGGGMPSRNETSVALDVAMKNAQRGVPGPDRRAALLELAAEALFAALLEEPS